MPKKDSYVKAEANGALTATNASISGNLNAASGKIGSFEIYENGLYSDFIELNKESLVLAGGNFTLKAGSTSNTGESISLNTSFNSSPAIIFSGNTASKSPLFAAQSIVGYTLPKLYSFFFPFASKVAPAYGGRYCP